MSDNNGVSMIIGGANDWACYGGSRIDLCRK
jgi:hypothetical protein